ncbi:MAG: hypothetical protein HFJ58_03125 [Clostridia bacterium]|nr:hypothetical protein [Clostridia bacterium]
MMFHLPYFSMPYYNRYSRYGYRYPYYSYGKSNSNMNSTSVFYNDNSMHNKKKSYSKNVNNNSVNKDNNYTNFVKDIKRENTSTPSSDSPLFQLFGINLYFDDILLICLIWFLYDEGVKDQELFIALILLLLS